MLNQDNYDFMGYKLNQFLNRLFRNFNKSFSDDQIRSEKNIIREEVKAAKKNLTEELKEHQAEAVYIKIERMNEFINAKTVLMYWSMNDELPTHKFIKKWSQIGRAHV